MKSYYGGYDSGPSYSAYKHDDASDIPLIDTIRRLHKYYEEEDRKSELNAAEQAIERAWEANR